MKNKIVIAGVVLLLALNSCKTDVDITADWKENMVVYGLLDAKATVHNIKINKAFLGSGNMLQYAAIHDSNVYQYPLDVRLIEMRDNVKIREIILDTMTVNNKQEGVFFSPNQIVYSTGKDKETILDPKNRYKLEIHNPKTGLKVYSETELVESFRFIRPLANPQNEIFLYNDKNDAFIEILWETAKKGRLYSLRVDTYIKEINNVGDTTMRVIPWVKTAAMESLSDKGGEQIKQRLSHKQFFSVLKSRVAYPTPEQENAIVERIAYGVKLTVDVANEEFNTYMRIYKPSNSLIDQVPDYSNIENARGLFASRTSISKLFFLGRRTHNDIADLDLKFLKVE